MKKYVKASRSSDVRLKPIQEGSNEELCNFLGLSKYKNLYAGLHFDDGEILIYAPEFRMEEWILIEGFNHDSENNTYLALLDLINSSNGNQSIRDGIEDTFGCSVYYAHWASDLITI